jgi:hypothetical protein
MTFAAFFVPYEAVIDFNHKRPDFPMKREHSLKRRLKSLETLSEAVAAMKSLSGVSCLTTTGF